jgi:hypothetical protein
MRMRIRGQWVSTGLWWYGIPVGPCWMRMESLLVCVAIAGALPVGLPGPFGTLHRSWPWLLWLLRLPRLGQQRWRFFPVEVRLDRPAQIIKHTSPLLRTRRHHRPYPLTPALPLLAARTLGDVPVDHHEPYRLLRQVVRRLHSWRRHEREVRDSAKNNYPRGGSSWPGMSTNQSSRSGSRFTSSSTSNISFFGKRMPLG